MVFTFVRIIQYAIGTAMEVSVHNNIRKTRFDLYYKKKLAYIDYRVDENSYVLIHTQIPQELHLFDELGYCFLKEIKQLVKHKGFTLKAECPYARALLKSIR